MSFLLQAIIPFFLAFFFTLLSASLFPSFSFLFPLLLLIGGLFLSWRKGKRIFLYFLAGSLLGIILFLIPHPSLYGEREVVGVVIRAKDNYFLLQSGLSRIYVYEKGSTREVGDILSLKGTFSSLSFTEYESRFSFQTYLENKRVGSEFSGTISSIFSLPFRFREWGKMALDGVGGDASSLLDSLLFDRKDYKAIGIITFEEAGLLYLLSASGLLYGTYLKFFEWLLGHYLSKKSLIITLLILSFLPLPLLLHKVGIWRIFLTRGIQSILLLKGKEKISSLPLTSFLGTIFLLFDHTLVLDQGFLLSFLLSLFMSLSSSLFLRIAPLKRKIASFCLLTFLIIPTFPQNGSLSLLAPIRATLFLPLIFPFLILGIIGMFTPLSGILNSYSSFLMNAAAFWKKIDVSIPFIYPEEALFAHFFFLAILLLLLSIGWKGWSKVISCFLITPLLLFNLVPSFSFLTAEVSFINVGQGDSILIRDGEISVLIDTGGVSSFDIAEECLIPFFQKRGIHDLDYVIITHGDSDHDGALPSLYDHFAIGKILREKEDFPLSVGSIHLKNLNTYLWEEENDNSLVLKLDNFLGKDFLFMGDATTKVERKLLDEQADIRSDILKVGHHGSRTSSSDEFLKEVAADTAIISCGRGNDYGHPDEEVMERLKNLEINIRRTDEEGTISYFGFAS